MYDLDIDKKANTHLRMSNIVNLSNITMRK